MVQNVFLNQDELYLTHQHLQHLLLCSRDSNIIPKLSAKLNEYVSETNKIAEQRKVAISDLTGTSLKILHSPHVLIMFRQLGNKSKHEQE